MTITNQAGVPEDEAENHEEGFESDHAPAADAVDGVADLLLFRHRITVLGEQEEAVDGGEQEEQGGEAQMEDVGEFDGKLEKAHGRAVGNPSHLAREQDDAQSEQAGKRIDDNVPAVIADVGHQDDAGGDEDAH